MARTRPALCWLLVLFSVPFVRAHAIEARCEVLPPGRVLVYAAYAGDGPAAGALVRVSDPQGNHVGGGAVDDQGRFEFLAPAALAYRFEIIVAGHRAACQLTPQQVDLISAGRRASGHQPQAAGQDTGEAARSALPLAELFAGLALILSLAAFVTALSLRRELRALEQRLESGSTG